jgi:hypothetical protein
LKSLCPVSALRFGDQHSNQRVQILLYFSAYSILGTKPGTKPWHTRYQLDFWIAFFNDFGRLHKIGFLLEFGGKTLGIKDVSQNFEKLKKTKRGQTI